MESNSQLKTEVAVLMQATCASTSGKSKLTYEVGRLGDSELHLRITGNSGTGAFSREWVPLRAVRDALQVANAGDITSSHLRSLFAGASINTPSFLLAVLASEGLVRASRTKKRSFECASEGEFATVVDAWKAGRTGRGEPGGAGKSGAKQKGAAKKRQREKGAAAVPSEAMRKVDAATRVGAAEAEESGSAKAKQNGVAEVEQNGAVEVQQNGADEAAQDGAVVTMQAIPSFTDLEPALPTRKDMSGSTKKKRSR